MRKHLVWVLALGGVLGTYGIAQALNTQTIATQVSPSKLPKNKRVGGGKFKFGKPIQLRTAVSTRDANNPNQRPSPSSVFNVDFDKDFLFNVSGVKPCTANITSASTATATQLCGKSKVSFGPTVPYGSGTPQNAAVVQPAVGSNINAVVTAFAAKNRTILLHTTNPVTGTTVLTGKLQKSGQAGFGQTLVVNTPPLAGGQASIIDFTVKVKKNYKKVVRVRGNRKKITVGYLGATCADKKLKTQARVTYADGSTATANAQQACTKIG